MEYTMKRAICFNDENDKFVTLSRGAHVRDVNNTFIINDEYVTTHFGMFRNDASTQHIISSTDLIEDYDIEPIRALKFTCDDTVTFNILHKVGYVYDLQYSFDGYNWQQLIDADDVNEWDYIPYNVITLNANETLYLRGNNPHGFDYIYDEEMCAIWFEMNGDGNVSCTGNMMHLLSYETDMMKIPCEGCFASFFYDCANLVSAPALPATTLTDNCYRNMFAECVNLINAPELPATTLTESCYRNMFQLCDKLETVQDTLPAMTLAENCYRDMFYKCESLTHAPQLPAKTLTKACYRNMFHSCTSLTHAMNELPARESQSQAYYGMFKNCTSLTESPIIRLKSSESSCCTSMFEGCTSLTRVTWLIETLVNASYTSFLSNTNGGTLYVHPQLDTTSLRREYIPETWQIETFIE